MTRITANHLKKNGISAIEDAQKSGDETVITVRGSDRYVVLKLEEYHHLRECELEAALIETRNDIKKGTFVEESIQQHLRRLS